MLKCLGQECCCSVFAIQALLKFSIKCTNENENDRTTHDSGSAAMWLCMQGHPSKLIRRNQIPRSLANLLGLVGKVKSCIFTRGSVARPNANVMACEMKVAVAFFIQPKESLDGCCAAFIYFLPARKNSNNQSEGLQRLIFLPTHKNSKMRLNDGLAEILLRRKWQRESAIGNFSCFQSRKVADLQFRVKSFSCF